MKITIVIELGHFLEYSATLERERQRVHQACYAYDAIPHAAS